MLYIHFLYLLLLLHIYHSAYTYDFFLHRLQCCHQVFLIAHRLAAFFSAYWSLLLDNTVFLLQNFHLSTEAFHPKRPLNLALCNIAVSYLVEDAEIRTILLAELLDKYLLAFIHKVTVAA